MSMNIEWNKVTWYSKLLAIIVLIAILWVGYSLGKGIGLIKEQGVQQQPKNDDQAVYPEPDQTQDQTPAKPQTKLVAGSAVAKASTDILGHWQSLQNADQGIIYNADGSLYVVYLDKPEQTIFWRIVDQDGLTIVESDYNGDNKRYYKIKKLESDYLEIMYTYNNKVLTYKRVTK